MSEIKILQVDHYSKSFFLDNEKIRLIGHNKFYVYNVDHYQDKFYFYDTELRVAQLTHGYYNGDNLAIELQRAINAVSGNQMYAVTVINDHIKIEASSEFKILMSKRYKDSI